MMDRRGFMAATGATGLAAIGAINADAAAEEGSDSKGNVREVYELRQYQFDNEDQVAGFDAFMEDAAIPALSRAGIKSVGVFKDAKGKDLTTYVLLPHSTMESVLTMTQKLTADNEFGSDGNDFVMAPAESPAYARVVSSLHLAFEGMPQMAKPSSAEGRVFQLRIYESPSVVTGQKKIEMFNSGEIDIFNNTGLTAVFFGETIIGDKMPNLTYMLGFDSMDDQKAAWKTFLADPDWIEISGKPEYANDAILSGITNIPLVAATYSQV